MHAWCLHNRAFTGCRVLWALEMLWIALVMSCKIWARLKTRKPQAKAFKKASVTSQNGSFYGFSSQYLSHIHPLWHGSGTVRHDRQAHGLLTVSQQLGELRRRELLVVDGFDSVHGLQKSWRTTICWAAKVFGHVFQAAPNSKTKKLRFRGCF